jgi:hypothetical protein
MTIGHCSLEETYRFIQNSSTILKKVVVEIIWRTKCKCKTLYKVKDRYGINYVKGMWICHKTIKICTKTEKA